jgi:FtsZ-interacting cell division protein YlmF
MACNKFLAFFTGACYAINGKTVKIKELTYLFARNCDFEDGSLNDFLQQI